MRQAVGTTWTFQLVIVFILLFASYIALTINYSKAFKVKNEVISIAEKYQGFTNKGRIAINSYLVGSGYQSSGECRQGMIGATSMEGSGKYEYVDNTNQKYYYCLEKITGYNNTYAYRSYYRVRLFFKFDLPVIGSINTFNVDGKTLELDVTYDSDFINSILWRENEIWM